LRLAYRSMLGNLNLRVFQKLDLSEAYGTQWQLACIQYTVRWL
jgi:hypothetical protein